MSRRSLRVSTRVLCSLFICRFFIFELFCSNADVLLQLLHAGVLCVYCVNIMISVAVCWQVAILCIGSNLYLYHTACSACNAYAYVSCPFHRYMAPLHSYYRSSSSGATECTLCEAGRYRANDSPSGDTCTECPVGTYR